MDRYVSVRTPESVAFSYELAGLGSRFLAVAVDFTIQVAFLALTLWLFWIAAGSRPLERGTIQVTQSLLVAIAVAVIFVIFFGYFIAFEALWNGQTPGKRMLGLRVVRDRGYPIDPSAAAIRNLVRVGEATIGFYAIAAIAVVLSPENKRLGDLAAATLVVRDAKSTTLEHIVERSEHAYSPAGALTQEEHTLVDRFIARRSTMNHAVRAQIAARLADRIRSRMPQDLQRLDDEELLARVSGS